MDIGEFDVKKIPIEKLKPFPGNARIWNQKALDDLEKSLKIFGQPDPLIVNTAKGKEFRVVGGNMRLEVLKRMGVKEASCSLVCIKDSKKELELNLRLNANHGAWDFDLLKDIEPYLLLDVGFDDLDFEKIWGDTLGIEDDQFDVEKEIEKIKTPKAKLGDLYQLGPHRLLCGDSTKAESYTALLGEERADMIYSDYPYNIGLNYNAGIGGKKNKYGSGIIDDSKTPKEYHDFVAICVKHCKDFCKQDAHFFGWCDQNYIGLFQSIYRKLEIKNQRVCLWIKGSHNPTPQVAFNKMYEPCIYGTIGKPYLDKGRTNYNEILNPEVETGKRSLDDIKDIFDIWLEQRLPGSEMNHPTEKPVTLHERPLKRCTKVGDIVLDQFCGSGSTLIACDQMKRRAFLMELDPIFIDLTIQRYETLTGIKAKKIN